MEVDRIDAALLAEELVEIYSTPTLRVAGAEKVNNLCIRLFFYNSRGLVFILGPCA